MTREKIYVRKLKDGSSRWLVATPLGGTIARVSSKSEVGPRMSTASLTIFKASSKSSPWPRMANR